MGFLDRARKMAEQAQAKLDEAQQQFDQRPAAREGAGPAPEHDQDGHPLTPMREEPSGASLRPPGAAGPSGDAPAPDPAAPVPASAAGGAPSTAGTATVPDPGVPHASGVTAPVGPASPGDVGASGGEDVPGTSASAPTAPTREREHDHAPPKLTGGDPLRP